MPSSHYRRTVIRTVTTPACSISGLESTRCAPSQEAAPDRITTLLQAILHQVWGSKLPWAPCAALFFARTERDTLRRILERCQLSSIVHAKTDLAIIQNNYHWTTPRSSNQVSTSSQKSPRSTWPSSRSRRVSLVKKTWLVFLRPRKVATQRTTIRCRNGGEAALQHRPSSPKCDAARLVLLSDK